MGKITLTKIARRHNVTVNEVKNRLVKKKVGRLLGQKVIPFDDILRDGKAQEFEDRYGVGDSYYKYDTDFIDSIFPKKKSSKTVILNYRDAVKNVKNLAEELHGEDIYFHTFKYEIERASDELMENIEKLSKNSQKIAVDSISYLKNSRAYQEKDMNYFL